MKRATFCGTERTSLRTKSIWHEQHCKRVWRTTTQCMSAAFVVLLLVRQASGTGRQGIRTAGEHQGTSSSWNCALSLITCGTLPGVYKKDTMLQQSPEIKR